MRSTNQTLLLGFSLSALGAKRPRALSFIGAIASDTGVCLLWGDVLDKYVISGPGAGSGLCLNPCRLPNAQFLPNLMLKRAQINA